MKQSNRMFRNNHGITLFIFFSITLVLLSSCNIRKPLQSYFDITVTKQPNPSQNIVNTGYQCQAEINNNLKSVTFKRAVFTLPEPLCFQLNTSTEHIKIYFPVFNTKQAFNYRKIPRYLLYQNLKLPAA